MTIAHRMFPRGFAEPRPYSADATLTFLSAPDA